MPTRTARTAWNGTLETGSGQVELSSSKVGTYDVSFPKRAADDAGGTTSPEELIAAAHSSCYAMQFSALLAEAGGTPESLEVTADVSLGTGDPVVVRMDDHRVGSLYCPAPQPALCGADAGTVHTATVPAGAAPVVLAQVTL